MSKVKFGVTKIHCEKTTRGEWARDEIYCAAIPIVGATQKGTFESDQIDPNEIEGRLMPGKVSTVKNRVKRGTIWKPSMEPVEIDMGEEKALCVLLLLFEEDNGRFREELIQKFETEEWPINLPEDPKYNKIIEAIVRNYSGDILTATGREWPRVVLSVLKSALAVAPVVFSEIRRDDLINAHVAGYNLTDTETCYMPREYRLAGRGGKYIVGVQLSEFAD